MKHPRRTRTLVRLAGALVLLGWSSIALAGSDRVRWRFEFPTDFAGAYVAVAEDGTVYATDNLGAYAINPEGDQIWMSPVGTGGGQPIGIGPDGTVYTGNSFIHAIDPTDGSLRWRSEIGTLNGLLAGPGVGPAGNLYAVEGTISDGIGFFSVDPSGAERWITPGDPPPQGFGSDNAPIVFSGDRFFAGFSDNAGASPSTYAFDLDGNQVWWTGFSDLAIPTSSSPRLAPDGNLIFRWAQNSLASLTVDGDVNWTAAHPDGASLLVSPAVGPDGAIYAGDALGIQLWSLALDGSTRWVRPSTSGNLGTLAVSPDNDVLVATGSTGGSWIRGYDPATGDLLWQVDLLPEEGLAQINASRHPFFSADGSTAYVTTRFVGDGVGHSYLYAIDVRDFGIADCQGIDGENVLAVSGDIGESSGFEILVDASATFDFGIGLPSGGGNGKFLVHLNDGAPGAGTITELPARLGPFCHPLFVPPFGEADPLAVWNNVGRRMQVGASTFFGESIPDPDRAPAIFFVADGGDPVHFPVGSTWTLQGAILNPQASANKPASVTNGIVLTFF